jgi:LacI family transcriptional regulator
MRITIEDIAKAAGVHPSTVSRAINGNKRISAPERERILAIATSLGYRANIMAKGLLGKRTNTMGIIAPKLDDLHAIALVNAEEAFLREMGCVAMMTITNCDEKTELDAIQNLTDRAVDGLIMNYVSTYSSVNSRLVELSQTNFPIVRIGGNSNGLFDEVDVDFTKWTYELINHLLEYGHRRIAIVVDSFDYDNRKRENSKFTGYQRALETYNLPYNPELVFHMHYMHQNIRNLMQQIMALKERPTAIFAYSDDFAGGLIKELIAAGYKVPEEVSVVGFNDDWFADRIAVSLTTCRLPANEIGRSAVELLMRRVNDRSLVPCRRMHDCKVIIRASTRRLEKIESMKESVREIS